MSWRFKLDLSLKQKDFFDVANGTIVKPAGPCTDAQVVAWSEKDPGAQILIGLNVSSNIALRIANRTSAYEILDKIQTL